MMLNFASGAPEDAKVRDASCMIAMLYEVYFKSVDNASGSGCFFLWAPKA